MALGSVASTYCNSCKGDRTLCILCSARNTQAESSIHLNNEIYSYQASLNPIALQERNHFTRNLVQMILQREMPSVNEMNLRFWEESFESLGSRGDEKHVVLAPDSNERGLILSEVLMEGRVRSDIGLIYRGCPY